MAKKSDIKAPAPQPTATEQLADNFQAVIERVCVEAARTAPVAGTEFKAATPGDSPVIVDAAQAEISHDPGDLTHVFHILRLYGHVPGGPIMMLMASSGNRRWTRGMVVLSNVHDDDPATAVRAALHPESWIEFIKRVPVVQAHHEKERIKITPEQESLSRYRAAWPAHDLIAIHKT